MSTAGRAMGTKAEAQDLRGAIRAKAEDAIRLREATPGMPTDGFYPASVGEVADELVAFINEMHRTCAPGLVHEVMARLGEATTAEVAS